VFVDDTNTNLRISVLHWFDCLKQLRPAVHMIIGTDQVVYNLLHIE